MATGIKGICYKETSQLNEFNSLQHKHLRNFWDETRHFTRLSSTIFDNVIYDSLYGCSVPGMPDDIMGGSAKRYSSVVSDSSELGNDSKRRSIQTDKGTDGCKKSEAKPVEKPTVDAKNQVSDTESIKGLPKDEAIFKDNNPCHVTPEKKSSTPDTEASADETLVKQDMPRHEVIVSETDLDKVGQETDLSNGKISAANSSSVDESSGKVPPPRSRSNSVVGVGRTRRNSGKIDITSTPLYKEIYANNLRQYGFLLAKKLGISNQSPKELRATYLQNRQKAELRREQNNSSPDGDEDENGPPVRRERSNSFADFGRRLSQCAPSATKEKQPGTPVVPIKDEKVPDDVVTNNPLNESPASTCKQTTSTRDNVGSEPRQSPIKNRRKMERANTIDATPNTTKSRMRRSNTIEYLDRCKDKPLGPIHTRSTSDLSNNKYSNSLTNITEMFEEGKQKSSRELRRMSCMERRKSYSPHSTPSNTPPLGNSTEAIDKHDESPEAGSDETCHQKQHSASLCGDQEENQIQATPVIMRRLKKTHDPHKRLSHPLLNGKDKTNCPSPPRATSRRSSTTDQPDVKSVMSSLSVPDLYLQSTFGKDKLMDAYCKQDVPRRKLSVDSLRRHNEAKERLERRMSKLKSFDGVLTEADSFMKDIQTRKSTSVTIPEEAIPE